MTRKLALSLSLLLSFSAFAARSRAVSGSSSFPEATTSAQPATVSGVVESVAGNLIRLAGGLVTIDAAGAKIVIDRGHEGTVAEIQPGMIVFAALSSADVAPNAPLPATIVTATRLADATLFGPVQSVDRVAGTLTLLGRTVLVTPQTSFGGFHLGDSRTSLADVMPNQLVQVQAENVGGRLIASSVLVVSPIIPEVHSARGKVKSIETAAWVISADRGDLTVNIDAQTRIAGSPKVGDEVLVLYRTDTANALIAISIVKVETPTIPNIVHFHGTVKSISGSTWSIAKSGTTETVTLTINERSAVQPGIVVGNTVDVLAEKRDDGTHAAILIVKLP